MQDISRIMHDIARGCVILQDSCKILTRSCKIAVGNRLGTFGFLKQRIFKEKVGGGTFSSYYQAVIISNLLTCN